MTDVSRFRSQDVLAAMGLAVAAAVALGFSRFAYALLLPPMRDALGLTYAEAGSLNTANGVGYIVGAVASAAAAGRWGPARPFQLGVLASALLLLATPLASGLISLLFIRTLGGFSTAFAFILGAALAGAITSQRDAARGGLLVGIYVAGAGAGIVLSGLAVPVALRYGAPGWREGWLVLGGLALVGVVPAWWAARHAHGGAAGAAGGRLGQLRRLVPTALGYGLFGAGYAGFMTFVIAYLRSTEGSGVDPAVFWIVLGAAATACTLLWGRMLGRLSGGTGPCLVYALTMLGTLPLLLWVGTGASLATAVIFGGSVLAGPTAITIVAKQQLPAPSLPLALSALTVSFALGQALGPLLSGAVTDRSGSVSGGLWTSPALLALAALVTLLQRPARAHRTDAGGAGSVRE